jgi:threonine dehydratase
MRVPTIADVSAAEGRLRGLLPVTPTWSYPSLSETCGCEVFVKHENVPPVGAFKVRGAFNLVAGMSVAETKRGVVAYSHGNHAIALAYAAARFGVDCVVVMPEGPDPAKAAAVRSYGAKLVESGKTFDEARAFAERMARERGRRLVPPGDDPDIIAGAATAYSELFAQCGELDALVVPVGSGGGAAGACLVADHLAPGCEVIAVQSAASPAAHDSWQAGRVVERPNRSIVDGLATGTGFELTQRIFRERLDDFLLVDDASVVLAQWFLLRDAHTVAERAGAAGVAALLAYPSRFAGKRVGAICTGGNATEAELRLAVESGATGRFPNASSGE